MAEYVSCQCVAFVDADAFVSGSGDCMVRLWRLSRKDGSTKMSQTNLLRAHSGPVVCVAACRAWSIIVSGSEDGSVAIWDLNRAIYVRSIWHDRANGNCAIRSVAINEATARHLDREFIIGHKLNQFVTGIYRFLFGPQTVPAHHQCPSNRRARLGSFDEPHYILNILGARIRAVRRSCRRP